MDSGSSSSCLFQSIQITLFLLFISFALVFCVFSFLIYIFRLKPLCDCDVCTAYVSSSWTKEFRNLCDWYTHLLRKSHTGTIHVHVLNNVVTANPDNVKHMLRTRFDNYPKGKPFSAILGDLLGRGIFNVDGDSWKFQRKMASLELGSVSIRAYAFEVVGSEITNRLVPLLSSVCGKEDGLDLQDVFRRFSFDSICKFSFGLDPGCLKLSLPASEFAEAFDTASRLSAERAMSPSSLVWRIKRLLNIGSERRLREAIKLVNALADEVIKQKREVGPSKGHNDLLSRFMINIDDDRYLRDIVVSFLLAGRDTVASALTSFFWLLSQNPKVRDAIREESDRVMGPTTDGLASFDQMRKMHYLQAALYECMRLYPPVQFDSKFAQDDDLLPDGTWIKKGTRVTYHPYAMGRMEWSWGPDCLEFRPERWLSKDGVFSPVNPYKYPVFQAGVRVCLGKEMALVEMKSVALALVRQFDILVAGGHRRPQFAPGLTATIRGGLRVVIEERSVASTR
ncbi:hypothetical protein BT93_J0335 [Corymbia citriodora subsp. variegata]|nr:hypothetical protein BT93_J0335 [Corymbia citriodora subsp. variegata]